MRIYLDNDEYALYKALTARYPLKNVPEVQKPDIKRARTIQALSALIAGFSAYEVIKDDKKGVAHNVK